MKESILLRGITDFLEVMRSQGKLTFFRSGSGKIKITEKRYFVSGKPGVQDITVLAQGKSIGLEVKTAVGTQSKKQKEWEAEWKEQGGEYYVVRSVREVKTILGFKTLPKKSP